MLKIMLFIDGTWLYRNTARLANSYGKTDFRLDYGRLPQVLAEEIGRQLNGVDVHVVRTYLFGSYADNCHDLDKEDVTSQLDFFSRLKEDYHYEVELFPLDFVGKRLRKIDRGPQDDFEPKEKCVDIALATAMLYYAAMPHAYDVAIGVVGDRDFMPVLQHVRRLGKQVAIASIKGSCAREFTDPRDNEAGVKDFDLVWLDDLLHRLELKYERHQLECQSPTHVGDRHVWTTYHPRKFQKFFCEACRLQYKEEGQQPYAGGGGLNLKRERGPQAEPGTTLRGIVMKKDPDRGFGFIKGEDGQDYFFHLSGLVPPASFETLGEGSPVDFTVKSLPVPGQAPPAENVRLRPESESNEARDQD